MKIYKVKVNGKIYEVELESVTENSEKIVDDQPKAEKQEVKPVLNGEGTTLKAPMQGTILDVKVKVGEEVKKGQV